MCEDNVVFVNLQIKFQVPPPFVGRGKCSLKTLHPYLDLISFLMKEAYDNAKQITVAAINPVS